MSVCLLAPNFAFTFKFKQATSLILDKKWFIGACKFFQASVAQIVFKFENKKSYNVTI